MTTLSPLHFGGLTIATVSRLYQSGYIGYPSRCFYSVGCILGYHPAQEWGSCATLILHSSMTMSDLAARQALGYRRCIDNDAVTPLVAPSGYRPYIG